MTDRISGQRYIYKTQGVCPAEIHFRIDGDVLEDLRFVGGGCPGNSLLVSRLLNGRPVDDIPAVLQGIDCRDGASCPDQLARALEAVRNRTLQPADTFRIHVDRRRLGRVALIGDLSGDHQALTAALAAATDARPDAVYCLGNAVGEHPGNAETIQSLRKAGVRSIQGGADWRYAQGTEPSHWPKMESKTRDRLIRLPQMLAFALSGKKGIAFYGAYLQQLQGYSDYDPYALEVNMVCGLADFMRDSAVFPALEAMTPQFRADLVLFGQTDRWGHWEIGGKHIIAVGPTSGRGRPAWGLLTCDNGDVRFDIMTADGDPKPIREKTDNEENDG